MKSNVLKHKDNIRCGTCIYCYELNEIEQRKRPRKTHVCVINPNFKYMSSDKSICGKWMGANGDSYVEVYIL
jgi:hypothetical protein